MHVSFIMAFWLEITQMPINCIFIQWKWTTGTGNVDESYKCNVEKKYLDMIEYKETVSIFVKNKTGNTKQ